jgi:hypothetical protein
MMECPNVISFWKTITKITGVKLPTLHPHTWASDVISGCVCSQRDAKIINCGAYALWNNRNKTTRVIWLIYQEAGFMDSKCGR